MRKDAKYSKKAVMCPKASTIGFGRYKAKPGDLIVFSDGILDSSGREIGRVLGRVDASGEPGCPKIVGHILVLQASRDFTSCYIRWIDPALVTYVTDSPTKFAAFFFQKEIPYDATTLIHLDEYGTLDERYIDYAETRVRELKAQATKKGGK